MSLIIKTPRSSAAAVVDFILTALAWAAFGYLFVEGIVSIVLGTTPGLAVPVASRLLPALATLLVYLVVAVCIAVVLFVWARYNVLRFGRLDRRKAPPALPNEALAASFGISTSELAALRASRLAVIHHNTEGRISGIDVRDVQHGS